MPDTRFLFLGSLLPKEIEAEVIEKSHNQMVTAANALQWNLISGLEENLAHPVDLVNLLPVYSFPRYYSDWILPTRSFSHTPGAEDVDVGYINIAFVKQFFKYAGLFSKVNAWIQKNQNDHLVIMVYSLEVGFLRCIEKIKRSWPRVHVCAVVADLPAYSNLSSKQSWALRMFIHWKSKRSQSLLHNVDSFALLTEQMREALQLADMQRWCVVEGIAKPTVQRSALQNRDEFSIVYTGTLHSCFGIETLVKAFRMINDPSFRLILCGTGDYKETLVNQIREDPRILYLGILSHEDALQLQCCADILVNPRQNLEAFTKYSFPSKTMEYLGAGRPVVAYFLDGIPKEYAEYLVIPEDNSPESLADCFTRLSRMLPEEREALGKRGQAFVLQEKNAACQTRKILNMIFGE